MLPEASDQVAAFAQQLGIHPDEDAEFGWLAEVGLQSPLPPRWTSHVDATNGFVYYVDHDRQVSSWENPLVPYLRRIVEIGRNYLEKRTEDFFEEQKGILWHQHKHDLDAWHGPFSDNEGRSYYVNSTAGVSSWQDPRVDAQYIFELESGLLMTLQEVLPPPEPDTPGWGEGNDPWKTSNGAEVLTLDDSLHGDESMKAMSGAVGMRGISRRLTQTLENWKQSNNRDEHKSTLEKMAHAAEFLRSAQQDEQEVQRLLFSKKVQERKQRRHNAAKAALRRSPGGNNVPSEDTFTRPSLCSAMLAPLPSQESLTTEPLGSLPAPQGSSPSSGGMSGRKAPAPLESVSQPRERPASPGTPGGPAVFGTPGTPAGATQGTAPVASPSTASPLPPSPLDLTPPPPPPDPGTPAPIVAAPATSTTLLGSSSAKQGRKENRLFATLAAAAPSQKQ